VAYALSDEMKIIAAGTVYAVARLPERQLGFLSVVCLAPENFTLAY